MRSLVRIIAITLNVLVGGYQLWTWGSWISQPGGLLRSDVLPYLVVPLVSLLAPVSAIAAIVLVPNARAENR